MKIPLLNYHSSSQNQRVNGFEEYLTHFWDRIVPYQRRQILPRRSLGELPHARMARYDAHHLAQLPKNKHLFRKEYRLFDSEGESFKPGQAIATLFFISH